MPIAFDCQGCDTDGNSYASLAEVWATALNPASSLSSPPASLSSPPAPSPPTKTNTWYAKSSDYWTTQSPDIQGMLGGLDALHARDISASRNFLDALIRRHGLVAGATARCVDVGAGIGRVTKGLLLPAFGTVDMLEQNVAYLEESKAFVGVAAAAAGDGGGTVGERIACGMQDFDGAGRSGRWELVWIQWCIIYLDDDSFVDFIRKLLSCLADGGIVVIKDNIAPRGKRNGFVLDNSDASIMRGDKYMKSLFAKAGAALLSESLQSDFPTDTFPVKSYALVSATDDRVGRGPRLTSRQAAIADATRASAGTATR